ncbi:MAG: hypothetical protein ACREDS_13285 [Limisphaerales bacterium]
MSHKPGDEHATPRQEVLDCDVLFHFISFGLIARQATPRPSPLDLPTICP